MYEMYQVCLQYGVEASCCISELKEWHGFGGDGYFFFQTSCNGGFLPKNLKF